jgi:hypothetical protein
MILRVDLAGKITEVSLANVKHSTVSLPDAPVEKEGRANPRIETITDMAFVDGKVFIAGLSNEEFSSSLRSISVTTTLMHAPPRRAVRCASCCLRRASAAIAA